jgi:pimeloyl-ACP methyl ester carboxylesterase
LLAFDFIGFGFSDKPVDYAYSIFDYADLFDKLAFHLNMNTRVNLIAHDMGDMVLEEIVRRYNLALQAPSSVTLYAIEKCVLFNGGIFHDIYQPRLSQKILRTSPINVYYVKYVFRFFILFKFSFLELFGQLNKPSDDDLMGFYKLIAYNDGHMTLPSTIGYLSERYEYNEVWLNALNETSVPVLFIYGPADPINPSALFAKKMRFGLPAVKFVKLADQVGHYPQWEDPFTAYRIMQTFLDNKKPERVDVQ